MGVFKKTVFLLVIGIALSLGLYSCSLFIGGTCEDDENINTELTSISKTQHIDSSEDLIERFSSIPRNRYGGFRVFFNTKRVAQNQFPQKPFSIFPSAYALDCNESDIYLKGNYPVSIQIFTVNDLDENTKAGDLVNDYFVMPFQTTGTENTQFDENDVTRSRFSIYTHQPNFYLDFIVRPSLTPYPEDIQFRIEIKLNTLRTWIETTSIIETR